MLRPSIAQDNRLDERGPTEIVDVIERRTGGDELAHDLDVPMVRSRNDRYAAVAVDGLERRPRSIASFAVGR